MWRVNYLKLPICRSPRRRSGVRQPEKAVSFGPRRSSKIARGIRGISGASWAEKRPSPLGEELGRRCDCDENGTRRGIDSSRVRIQLQPPMQPMLLAAARCCSLLLAAARDSPR